MTAWRRALLGGLIGALGVLCFHPATRPYFALLVGKAGRSVVLTQSPLVVENAVSAPKASSLGLAAYWMILASHELRTQNKLPRESLQTLLHESMIAGQEDTDNAFWPQITSVLYSRLGNLDKSREFWARAAHCSRWNDYQNWRIQHLAADLKDEYGEEMAWHYAALLDQRARPFFSLIRGHSATLLAGASDDAALDLDLRMEILRNGRLLYEGGRTIDGGKQGIVMIDRATRPFGSALNPTVRERLQFRQAFLDQLAAQKRLEDRAFAESTFVRMDSWLNLMDSPEIRHSRESLVVESAVVAAIPGALLGAMFVGVALWTFGALVVRMEWAQYIFHPVFAPLLGIALGALTYHLTRLWLPSLWAICCLAFFAFQPARTRVAKQFEIEPLGKVGLGIVGLPLFIATFTAFAVATGSVLMLVDLPSFEFTSFSYAFSMRGVALVLIGLTVFTAPLWGLARKQSPAVIAGLHLSALGRTFTIVAASLAIVVTPLVVWKDRELKEQISRLAMNEPGYYLSQ